METNTMQKEVDDIPKILEQEIFTQGVLGYCSHFSIPNKNNYNINFPHFVDFESLYLKEKYLKQFFEKNSALRDPKVQLPVEASTSLNQVLIAKNVSHFLTNSTYSLFNRIINGLCYKCLIQYIIKNKKSNLKLSSSNSIILILHVLKKK